MSDESPLIRAVDLAKTYHIGNRPVEVLRGVSIEIAKGQFVALRGASGAGKSTLLHLLGGLDRPNHGTIEFSGTNLAKLSGTALSRLRNRHIGFIFQSYHLLPELDALENVSIAARIGRRDAGETEAAARGLLERVGLADRLDHLPAELSGGEQQRVSIARALINGPALILADEPTGNLDSATGNEILDLLQRLRENTNVSMVIATHDAAVAARAERTIELQDGTLAGSP
jgi:ABC-type lipoprotein export system ATPase subunit